MSLSFTVTVPNLPPPLLSSATPLSSLLALASVALIVAVLAVSVVVPVTASVPAACVMAPPASTFRSPVSVTAGSATAALISRRSRLRSETAGSVGAVAPALMLLKPKSRSVPPLGVVTVTVPWKSLFWLASRMSLPVPVSILNAAAFATTSAPVCVMSLLAVASRLLRLPPLKASAPPAVMVRSVSAAVVPVPPTLRPLAAVSLSFTVTVPNLPPLVLSSVTPPSSLLPLPNPTLIVADSAVTLVTPATVMGAD